MPRSSRANSDDDEPDDAEEEDEEEEEEDELEPPPRRRPRPSPRHARARPKRAPVKRWRTSEEEEDEEEGEGPRVAPAGKKPVYWRARDSLFFEPLVALAIIVVVLVGLFAYTQNWPPVYVVESDSMQHGPNDHLGLINTGDLVLAQKVSLSGITPYVTGLQTGYSTYGEYGDVILYWPNGQGSTPIIHRAILYLDWNPHGFYNATDLQGLPCGTAANAVYSYLPPGGGAPPNCNTTGLTGTLELHNIGWSSVNVSVVLSSSILGAHSGFLTMGDNNPGPDQPTLSQLVEPGWIVGVARGMIPWFGSLKLLLEGQSGEVPSQSWEFMGLTVVGIILVAFGVHYALRTEGIETPLRREEDEEARAESQAAAEESIARRILARLRRRRPEDEEEGEEEEAPRRRTRPPTTGHSSHRGRPTPKVRRSERPSKKSSSDDDL